MGRPKKYNTAEERRQGRRRSEKSYYDKIKGEKVTELCRFKHAECNNLQRAIMATYCHEHYNIMQKANKYNITPLEVMELHKSTNCGICKEVLGKKKCIDHCHSSGNVRGLLCHNCNVMIGHGRDNISTLTAAIEYLKINDERK
tara:strand:+ start:98 stop:529 length:432 start_codon:yes stop_codon:yes gene_type:complete